VKTEVEKPNTEILNEYALDNLRSIEKMTDEEINALEIINNGDDYCIGCIEDNKFVEPVEEFRCDDCEFEHKVGQGDFLYDCYKEGDYR